MTVELAIIPDTIGAEAEVDITFATAQTPSEGGVTQPKAQRIVPIRRYTCEIGPEDVAEVRAIYISHFGPRYPFALKDWDDNYSATNEILDYIEETGPITIAPLRRLIQPSTGTRSFYQRVLVPDQRVTPLEVFLNGIPIDAITGLTWQINFPGIIEIDGDIGTGATITWSGRYLVPVRFADDQLPIKLHTNDASTGRGIQEARFQEILEAELIALTS